jgi:RHS repeat-associated protein
MKTGLLNSILARACVALALALPGFASADPDVKLPNGEYREIVEDLKVQAVGGAVVVSRTWQAENVNKGLFRWYLNPAWADLAFEFDALDGSVKSVVRGDSTFDRNGDETFVYDKVFFIAREKNAGGTTTGWRWYDRLGNWIRYGADGKIASYGDRNDVTVSFVRNAAGRIFRVVDHHGTALIEFEYDSAGTHVVAVKDRTNRRVRYEYTGDLLTGVVDVLGRRWQYGYTNGLLTSKSGPTCDPDPTCGDPAPARTTTIRYAGNRVVAIVDPSAKEQTWEYAFDRGKRIYTVVEKTPADVRLEKRFGADGRLISLRSGVRDIFTLKRDGNTDIVTDERGMVTRSERDANRNIVKTIHPDGTFRTSRFHSRYNFPVERIDENGVVTRYEYDTKGNLLNFVEAYGRPEARTTTYAYDEYGQIETISIHGVSATPVATTTYVYDGYGNVEKTIDAQNHEVRMEHDVVGNMTKRVDERGKTWTYVYDAAGRAESSKNPLNLQTRWTYDKFGDIRSLLDPLGRGSQFGFDVNRRLANVTGPTGTSIAYTRNDDGRVTAVADTGVHRESRTYDADGRLKTVSNAAGDVETTVYGDALDEAGLVVSKRFPTYCESYKYDQRRRVTSTTRIFSCDDPESVREVSLVGYDALGQVVTETDAMRRTTLRKYDALGRVVEVVDAANGTVKFGYDVFGNRTSITDQNGSVNRYVYDLMGRVVSEIRPSGGTISYAYDAAGNLVSRTAAGGERRVYVYDDASRLVSEKAFDAGSNVPARTVAYQYDDSNLLLGYVQAGTAENSGEYTYDDAGRTLSETVTFGSGAQQFSRTISTAYWPNGAKKSVTYPDGTSTTFTHTADRQLESAALPGGGEIRWEDFQWSVPRRVTMPGVVRSILLDPLRRPSDIHVRAIGGGTAAAPAGPELYAEEYEYDANGNVVEKTTPDGSFSYAYDTLNRLTGSTPPVALQGTPSGLPVEGYGYDAAGNRVGSVHQPGPWNYDGEGRLLGYGANAERRVFTYDANGNVQKVAVGAGTVPDKEIVYKYNASEQLVQVTEDSTVVARYEHDPFGRRVRKQTQQGVVWFQYSAEGLVAEYRENGGLARAYGWKPGGAWGADPLWMADVSGGVWHLGLYHNDHLGTPQRVTNPAGEIVWSGVSEAFGATRVGASSTVVNPLRLPGQYFDEETGLHYNFRRNYAPTEGRYREADPIGVRSYASSYLARTAIGYSSRMSALDLVETAEEDSSLNALYRYVDNRPLFSTDPTGLAGSNNGSGGSSGRNTSNPYKHCRELKERPGWVECQDKNGKWIPKPKPWDWDQYKSEQCPPEETPFEPTTPPITPPTPKPWWYLIGVVVVVFFGWALA